ncbi:tRNA (adenosine(37)-N6)-dimethylallyltransferase MiaA [Pararhodobacter sp. SW119]|uniref:tRNA (adenosine(37)-N6)-dimethylallyltransferase MiaA n=1 Tax=Pararhodobacter sp. SW119 TaxID=2780075 RepID=UPI001ADFB4E0|nr:tRNA (adenosine(37)-N6)-dimethylallyltransferase MiaA [Pararhodobacter sp. SW119]
MPPLAQLLPDPDLPVLIAGPTASGKSALALNIAAAQGRVVVNADALQVYDAWRVLTARPTPDEAARVPHLLYGHVARDADYSVGHWLREVGAILDTHPNAVVVGGTGLYFAALTEGLATIPPVPAEVRATAEARLRAEGAGALLAELDPPTALRIDRQNPARIQRAWEVLAATERGLAQWQEDTDPPILPLSRTSAYLITPDREWLARRIARRFAAMLREGAIEEARTALPHWPASEPMPPWTRAIGATELIAHLRDQMSLPEVEAAATLATRQYAKRQRTWFRNRMRAWRPLDPA